MSRDRIKIQPIPPLTPTEEEHRLAELGWSPRRYITREELEREYQGIIVPSSEAKDR